MRLTDRAEEILESLWIELVENKKDTCSPVIVRDDDDMKALVASKYVEIIERQIRLTDKGKEEARNCIRRHRLAERLLADVLDCKKTLLHETSCRFEHLLHKGLDDSICTLLGHPKTCPHGQPIPEGECCKDSKRMPRKLVMPLSQLDVNKKARVAYLQTRDPGDLRKLITIGALPNTEIILIQKFPSYAFQIGKTQFAIDKELASSIYVRIT